MKYAIVALAFIPLVAFAGTEYASEFAFLLAVACGGLFFLDRIDGHRVDGHRVDGPRVDGHGANERAGSS